MLGASRRQAEASRQGNPSGVARLIPRRASLPHPLAVVKIQNLTARGPFGFHKQKPHHIVRYLQRHRTKLANTGRGAVSFRTPPHF